MSEPKSRYPVASGYQSPQGLFIPCLLLELLRSTVCLEPRTHRALLTAKVKAAQSRSLSLVGTRMVAGRCWEPGDKPHSRGISKSQSCSAVAQSKPSPCPGINLFLHRISSESKALRSQSSPENARCYSLLYVPEHKDRHWGCDNFSELCPDVLPQHLGWQQISRRHKIHKKQQQRTSPATQLSRHPPLPSHQPALGTQTKKQHIHGVTPASAAGHQWTRDIKSSPNHGVYHLLINGPLLPEAFQPFLSPLIFLASIAPLSGSSHLITDSLLRCNPLGRTRSCYRASGGLNQNPMSPSRHKPGKAWPHLCLLGC